MTHPGYFDQAEADREAAIDAEASELHAGDPQEASGPQEDAEEGRDRDFYPDDTDRVLYDFGEALEAFDTALDNLQRTVADRIGRGDIPAGGIDHDADDHDWETCPECVEQAKRDGMLGDDEPIPAGPEAQAIRTGILAGSRRNRSGDGINRSQARTDHGSGGNGTDPL